MDSGNTAYYMSGSNLIRRKSDWSESRKEIKVVAIRDKKRKKRRANCSRGLKEGPTIFKFFKIC